MNQQAGGVADSSISMNMGQAEADIDLSGKSDIVVTEEVMGRRGSASAIEEDEERKTFINAF